MTTREAGSYDGTALLPSRCHLAACRAHVHVRSQPSVAAESTAAILLGRYGEPEDYASVLAFLASR